MLHYKYLVLISNSRSDDEVIQSFGSLIRARKWIKTSGKRLYPYHKLYIAKKIK